MPAAVWKGSQRAPVSEENVLDERSEMNKIHTDKYTYLFIDVGIGSYSSHCCLYFMTLFAESAW